MSYLIGLGIVVAAIYLAGPIVVLLRLEQRIALRRVQPAELPAEVRSSLEAEADALAPLGFARLEWFAGEPPPRPEAPALFGLLLRSEDTLTGALVTVMRTSQRSARHLELCSVLADGHEVNLSTSAELVFPAHVNPQRTLVQVPWCSGPDALLRDHHRLRLRLAGTRAAGPFPVVSVDALQAQIGGDHARAVAAGYLRPSGHDRFRLTVRGAFLLTWRQLWPISVLVRALRDRRARRLLASLD